MKPVSKTISSATTSDWIKLDINAPIFAVGFGCVVTGTATYTVEHTFDDVEIGTPVVFSHPSVAAKTASADGNYAFPVRAIRLNVSATTGSVKLTLIQAG